MAATLRPFELMPIENQWIQLVAYPELVEEEDREDLRAEFAAYQRSPARADSVETVVHWLVIYKLLPALVNALERRAGVSFADRVCFLTGRVMSDPVRDPHGHVFEKGFILARLRDTPGCACPLGGASFTERDLKEDLYYHLHIIDRIQGALRRFSPVETVSIALADAKNTMRARNASFIDKQRGRLRDFLRAGAMPDAEYQRQSKALVLDLDRGLPTIPPPVDSARLTKTFVSDYFPVQFAARFGEQWAGGLGFPILPVRERAKLTVRTMLNDEPFATAFAASFAAEFDPLRGGDRAVAQRVVQAMVTDERATREFTIYRDAHSFPPLEGEGVRSPAEVVEARRRYYTDGAAAPRERRALSKTVTALGEELTARAETGELSPAFGRDEEITDLVRVLNGTEKAAALLIGAAGSGKTAIIEGLALRIAQGRAPGLEGCNVFSVTATNLQAGASYTGQFEERIKNLLEETADGKTVLVIDEFHTMVGAGTHAGSSIDAIERLKAALTSGLKLIGAMTPEDYAAHPRLREPAVARRFQTVLIAPPTPERALQMLRGLRSRYEGQYNLRVLDNALEASIFLTHKYMPWRSLPDKAIDLVRMAAAKLSTQLTESRFSGGAAGLVGGGGAAAGAGGAPV